MARRRPAALAAVAAALLLGVVACGNDTHPAASESSSPTTTASSVIAAPPPDVPLPPPEALTDVLYRLSDTSIPGDQKVDLVEGAGAGDERLDKFGKALADSGYTPVGFTAENIAWATDSPGNVTADVTVHSQNPAMANGFTFPMEFKPDGHGGWQLSKTTADILLTYNQNPALPTPTR